MDPRAWSDAMAGTVIFFLAVGALIGVLLWVGGGSLLHHLHIHWR